MAQIVGQWKRIRNRPKHDQFVGVISNVQAIEFGDPIDFITVLTVNSAGTKKAIKQWIKDAIANREWEPRH